MMSETPVNPITLIINVRQNGNPSRFALRPMISASKRIIDTKTRMVDVDISFVKN